MSNKVLLILLFILNLIQSKLISVLALSREGSSFPDELIENNIVENEEALNLNGILSSTGFGTHVEFGRILKMKYITTEEKGFDHNKLKHRKFKDNEKFTNVTNFWDKAKFFASSSQASLESAVAQASGLFPFAVPKIISIHTKGKSSQVYNSTYGNGLPAAKSISNTTSASNISSLYTDIEFFSENLDVILNSESCLQLKSSPESLSSQSQGSLGIHKVNTTILESDFIAVMQLKNIFSTVFNQYCISLKCKDDSVFRDMDFFHRLYYLITFMMIQEDEIANLNLIPDNRKIIKETSKILFKYHLIHMYILNSQNFKTLATPLFRFVNGFLESANSKRCKLEDLNDKIATNSTEKKLNKHVPKASFLHLNVFKPIDVLRRIILESKCKKMVMLISKERNLVTFVKALFKYENPLKEFLDNFTKLNSNDLDSFFISPKSSSFIFQVHQYSNDEKLFVRIFYNLQEIDTFKVQLKVRYTKKIGVALDELVAHLNDQSDSKLKYKDICDKPDENKNISD